MDRTVLQEVPLIHCHEHKKLRNRDTLITELALTFTSGASIEYSKAEEMLVHNFCFNSGHSYFRNRLIFYGEELLSLRPTPKLEDHPLSAVRDCLFNIFAAALQNWRASPPSAT
jgi:hypothetical protein